MDDLIFMYFIVFVILLPLSLLYHPYYVHFTAIELILMLLLSPIVEEYVFRGALYELLQKFSCNIVVTILLINILFTLLHVSNVNYNILYLLGVFICGVIFTLTRILYKSVFYSILVHAYYNLMYVVLHSKLL